MILLRLHRKLGGNGSECSAKAKYKRRRLYAFSLQSHARLVGMRRGSIFRSTIILVYGNRSLAMRLLGSRERRGILKNVFFKRCSGSNEFHTARFLNVSNDVRTRSLFRLKIGRNIRAK